MCLTRTLSYLERREDSAGFKPVPGCSLGVTGLDAGIKQSGLRLFSTLRLPASPEDYCVA